jgi:hypothetical protein
MLHGAVFSKRAPLAAGGKKIIAICFPFRLLIKLECKSVISRTDNNKKKESK